MRQPKSSDARTRPPQEEEPLKWTWPPCPTQFIVHDKYAQVDKVLRLEAEEWVVPVQGVENRFRFAEEPDGLLQRKLVTLTQAEHSPSSITKFTRSLLKNWPLYLRLMGDGPDRVREHWADSVLDVDTAKAGKKLLKLLCTNRLGGWTPAHQHLVRSLDTRAKQGLAAQQAKVKQREKVLPVATQAEVVRVLDTAALTADTLSEQHVEGLSALALVFQFGMRPVQILSLGLDQVSEPSRDKSGMQVLVISFHQAKSTRERMADLHRAVKPEWVPLLALLQKQALEAGRNRLFSCTSADAIWARVRKACKAYGVLVDFKAYSLRHTSIQSLADAGHDRRSIQAFSGHATLTAASTYLRATRSQATLINKALGASKLYTNLDAMSKDSFITVEQLEDADEDKQIGAVVGGRLVSGIGMCRTGQSSCPVNPVSSCYSCAKFMPVAQSTPHLEAIASLRAQVLVFKPAENVLLGPAVTELSNALSGAQQALLLARQIEGGCDE